MLDNYLQCYRVNPQRQAVDLVLEHAPNGHLNLASEMHTMWPSLSLKPNDEVFLILGPHSGFTDARILYMWLQSRLLFTKGLFFVHASTLALDMSRFSYSDITHYLDPIRKNNSRELAYTREPKIGKR